MFADQAIAVSSAHRLIALTSFRSAYASSAGGPHGKLSIMTSCNHRAECARKNAVVRIRQLRYALYALLLLAAAPVWAAIQPYIPKSPQVVLQHVPNSSDPRVRRFQQLRSQLNRAPRDLQRALSLAKAYLDYGRSTGDARYVGRAMAVIEPWLRARPLPIPVQLMHATLLQTRHQFKDSRAELNTLLKRDPGNAQAWLTLATVAMVQADYPAANDACVHLAQVGGNFYGLLCTAQLRSLRGQAQQAYTLLTMIEQPSPHEPADFKAYIEGLLAEAAMRLGKDEEADAHFRAALQWAPGDNFLLADYADFLLDRNRPKEVITLLADYGQSDTSFLRTVFAEAALHDPNAGRDAAEMQARFAAMEQRGSTLYQREHAEFVLRIRHNPAAALKLAKQNWNVQRAPQDMRICLQAALAADRPQAAKPVLALLAQSHLQDAVIEQLTKQASLAMQQPPLPTVAARHGAQP